MKKVLIVTAAVAALAACTTETLMESAKEAIVFDNTFVDNATRAAYDGSYNNSNLQEFQVYATITGTGSGEGTANIFNGEKVVKGNSLGQGANWSYAVANTQYWIPGNTYTFRAIADGNVENVSSVVALESDKYLASSIVLDDASAQRDILIAEETVNYTSGSHTVGFTFDHILSKAKFTVRNTIATNNGYSYKVYNLQINDVAKNGVYTFGAGWSAAAVPAEYDLAFGHAVVTGTAAGSEVANIAYNGQVESNYDRLLIPAVDKKLNITFRYELLKDGTVIDTQDKEIETAALTLKSGQAYNFVISLGNPGEPIQFDVVKVNDWDERAPIIMDPIEVASTAQLQDAISNGQDVVLTTDIDLDVLGTKATSVGLVIDKDVVIDGNGFTIKSSHDRAINVSGAENVYIKNLTIKASGERAINVIQGSKNVAIENVTAVAANYTVNVASSAPGAKITIKDSDLKGLNTVNIASADAVVNISNTKLTCNDENKNEKYSAIAINKDAKNAVVAVEGGQIDVKGDSDAGEQGAEGSQIIFKNVSGNTTISNTSYAIMYGDYYYSFATFEQALEKAKAGETIILTKDVTIESNLNITKSITLDLNGKTLTAAKEGSDIDAIWVRDNAEVVITGNGTINASFDAVFATGTSKVTIENGTFIGAAEAVYAQANATVIINGGSFKSTEYPEFTLNLKDSARATASIIVNGGSFYMFNPADNAAEGEHTNFVAAGKTVEQNGDWYIVK